MRDGNMNKLGRASLPTGAMVASDSRRTDQYSIGSRAHSTIAINFLLIVQPSWKPSPGKKRQEEE